MQVGEIVGGKQLEHPLFVAVVAFEHFGQSQIHPHPDWQQWNLFHSKI